MQRGYGFAQHQGPAAATDDRQRIQAADFRRRGAQVEFEHAAFGHAVVAGGVDPARKCAHLVDAGRVGQEGKHISSLPMTSGAAAATECGQYG